VVARVVPPMADGDDELEARPVGPHGLVDEISAVGPRVRTGDGETKTRAESAGACLIASAEALKKIVDELQRHTLAAVLDGEPKVPVALRCRDDHRRAAVAQSVRQQVRDDT